MKTLKKTLCLVLALVMVFGLCAVSASAKLEYTDNDDIEYKEAVDVMSGIGILAGDARGFRPADNITRAEAAKIIAYIMIGNAGQADALKAGSDPFSDVPASHWAAGYISYCATAGIIAGMGDGYHPNDNVTGLQFAKMLLCALGYGVNDEYVGADWAINVSRDALRLGVFEDNLAGANNNPATREECALYAFNTITGIDKVSYSALLGGYITNIALQGTDSPDANKEKNFADDFKLKSKDTELDPFKRDTGHHWYINDSKMTVITADYDADKRLKAVYTTEVTGDDIYNLLGSDAKDVSIGATVGGTATADRYAVYWNGASADDTTDGGDIKPATEFVKGNGDALDHTGNGVQTYVYSWYTNGNINIKICIIDTYLAKVDDVVEGTAKKDPATYVTILNGKDENNGTVNRSSMQPSKGYKTEDFEENDYVLVTMTSADKVIRSMEAVKTVEDEITRYNKTGTKITVTADGTDYVAAKNTAYDTDIDAATDTDTVNKGIVNGKDHVLYVDNYGYLIGVAEVEAASRYVYAAHFGDKTDVSGDFDVNGIAVKVYYADGTSAVLPLYTKNDTSGHDAEFKATGTPATLPSVSTLNSNKVGIYKLTMKSGKAVLTSTGITADGPGDGYVKQSFASSPNYTQKANNKTVFFYVKWDADSNDYYAWDDTNFKVTAYTGINSVPVNKAGDKAQAKGGLKNGSDLAAVLVKDDLAGDATDTVYFFTGDYNVDKSNWTVTYETYVNGVLEPLEISYETEEKKNDGVALFTDPGTGFVNKFFTLDGNNEPDDAKVLASYTTAINKAIYEDSLTDITVPNDFEISATGTTGGTFATNGMKIIDLTGNDDVIRNVKSLEKADAKGTIQGAVQLSEAKVVTYLYITGAPANWAEP